MVNSNDYFCDCTDKDVLKGEIMKIQVIVKNRTEIIRKIDEVQKHLEDARKILTWDLANTITFETEPAKIDYADPAED